MSFMSVYGIYLIVNDCKDLVQSTEKKEEREKKQKLIDDETELFNSLSFEKKKKYLKENANSLISSYVENYFKKNEKIKLLNNLIRIENELQEKFNDKFYSEINLLNFNEKLNIILNSIKEEYDVKIYHEEKVLEDKIKFFTFFQIFNDDLYNIDLQPLKNGALYTKHRILFNNKISINENFIIKLNETLKNTETPFVEKQILRIQKSGGPIYLKTLIQNHIINNYEKIVGDVLKIENLNQLYKKYKDLESRYIPFNELGIGDRLGKWNYVFYEEKNIPEVSMITNNKNYTIAGKKVLKEIDFILENEYEDY